MLGSDITNAGDGGTDSRATIMETIPEQPEIITIQTTEMKRLKLFIQTLHAEYTAATTPEQRTEIKNDAIALIPFVMTGNWAKLAATAVADVENIIAEIKANVK